MTSNCFTGCMEAWLQSVAGWSKKFSILV